VAWALSDEEDVMPLLLFVVVDDPDDTDDPDDDEAVLEDPEVAWVVVLFDAVLVSLVPLVPLPALVCVEPGKTAATAPAPITLATPTPAVAAASRRIPRRRNTPGGIGRSAGLTGIVAPFGPGWPAGARGRFPHRPRNRHCTAQRSEHSGLLLNRL
jgi:hypothetical protein